MAGSRVDAKIVLLGKSYAGKTSIVERYLKNRFLGDTVPYQNTIGAAFGAKSVTVGGKSITIGIWDTAGSERYEAMSRIYYRGARAAILCYDLTDKASFDRIRFWIGELRQHEENCKIYLCGTKCDLVAGNPDRRAVTESTVKSLAIDCMADQYETSSKTGKDIDKLFMKICVDFMSDKEAAEKRAREDAFMVKKDSGQKGSCSCSS